MVVTEETCYLCGKNAKFKINDDEVLYREAVCEFCGTSIRNSDMAKVFVDSLIHKDLCLIDAISYLGQFRILGTCSSGVLHSVLKDLPGYVFGEYYDGVESGNYKNGIICIDLTDIPFDSNYFDVIITEDVLEHIDNINVAFREINRVLKPQGLHLFSVPLHENKRTLDRTNLKNKVYHGDPIRPEGALVYTDFGNDIEIILNGFGMSTERLMMHQFFKPEELTNVDLTYSDFLNLRSDPLKYFKYNSVVFKSKKAQELESTLIYKRGNLSLDFTGERFVPSKITGEIVAEHFHRYQAVSKLLKNKKVLDAACGEGYGSFILAHAAKQVIGIDISREAVANAKQRYRLNNLNYLEASIQKLPFNDNEFDAIISFETIEHVDENIQQDFLKEIKRVLKDDGILIMSTPDKAYYSDKHNYNNEYHMKEFYFDEFKAFLNSYFSNVYLYNQGIEIFSIIGTDEVQFNEYYFENKTESWQVGKKYIIAMCSNYNLSLDTEKRISSIIYQNKLNYEATNNKIEELYNTLNVQNDKYCTRLKEQCKALGECMEILLNNKKVVYFGTGSALQKILNNFQIIPEYFIDNNSQKWGSSLFERLIYPPSQLLNEEKDKIAIIITSQYYEEIAIQLKGMGFKENVHFWNGRNLIPEL